MNDAEFNKLLGNRIKELRKARNLSQFQLAVKCGFEKSNMARLEAGRTNPTIGTLLKISSALNIEIKELINV